MSNENFYRIMRKSDGHWWDDEEGTWNAEPEDAGGYGLEGIKSILSLWHLLHDEHTSDLRVVEFVVSRGGTFMPEDLFMLEDAQRRPD